MGRSDAVLPVDLQSNAADFNLRKIRVCRPIEQGPCRRLIVGRLLTFGLAA